MTTAPTTDSRSHTDGDAAPAWRRWLIPGAMAAVGAAIAVVIVQAAAIAVWPDIASFRLLDNLARSALFAAVPAVVATGIFAWMVGNRREPVRDFMVLAGVVLVLSVIPDYTAPVEGKTFLASTVTAFLHVVAAVVTVGVLVRAYRRGEAGA